MECPAAYPEGPRAGNMRRGARSKLHRRPCRGRRPILRGDETPVALRISRTAGISSRSSKPSIGSFSVAASHLADNGQIDRGQEEVRAVGHISRLANVDLLPPLHKDNQAGFVCSRGAGSGCGAAVEPQSWYFSERVSFRNGTISNLAGQLCPHLNYLVTLRLHPCVLPFAPASPLQNKVALNSRNDVHKNVCFDRNRQ